ncbi:MAG: PspA-associated protein PspAA [Actinomycetota bacterium]
MILRILEEGQYEVPDEVVDALNPLDEDLVAAIEAGDQARFQRSLAALLERVRESGSRMADDYLGPSDLVLPPTDASLEEVAEMLSEEGLIPG